MSYLGGTRVGRTVTPRVFSLRPSDQLVLPGPTILDGTNSLDNGNTGYTWEIRAGMIMAQVTATKKWVPCGRTAVVAGGSGSGTGVGSTTIPVTDARAFKAGDEIEIVVTAGQGEAAGTVQRTVSSVDYTNNLIVVTVAAQYNTGAAVFLNAAGDLAGAEIPRGILKETVTTINLQDAIDAAALTKYDKPCQIVYRDYVDVNYILGDYAACRAATVQYLDGIQWSDEQQGIS